MFARLLAGGACAVALLASLFATPAAAHPYDRYAGGSRSFFASLFGPSIARGVVSYPTNQKPGTIVVSTAQRRLYLVLGNGQALSYAIAVGAAGYAWSGASQITDKREWPDWTPPEEMLQRRPDLPRHMTGGPRAQNGKRDALSASSRQCGGSPQSWWRAPTRKWSAVNARIRARPAAAGTAEFRAKR